MIVTKTQMSGGVWQGVVSGASSTPALSVTHLDQKVSDISLTPGSGENTWMLSVPIPNSAISDGVQTLLIKDAITGETLDHITVIAGEALNEDLRAEVDLLRAELDMLKRAFRRHCVETG